MFTIVVILFLMATAGPVARSHGGDGGGRDPDRPRRLPAPCDESGKTVLKQDITYIFKNYFYVSLNKSNLS